MATGPRYLGKVVIVTGGTSGMGLAIVREFARQGSTVVFCEPTSDEEKGQAVEKELQDSGYPGDTHYQLCDVRNESDIKRLILVTIERHGRLDCLVSSAGTGYPQKIDDTSAQDFCNMMEINTVSCFLAAKYALPYLRETRGNIINIASLYGVIGSDIAVSYDSSKGAVIAMTKALAVEESKYGVRVNSISPSNIWSPLWEKEINRSPNPEARIQEVKSYQLMGRFGTPEEVALAALYLAADGTFCTGLNLPVSGGAEIGFGIKSRVDPDSYSGGSGNSQDSSDKQ